MRSGPGADAWLPVQEVRLLLQDPHGARQVAAALGGALGRAALLPGADTLLLDAALRSGYARLQIACLENDLATRYVRLFAASDKVAFVCVSPLPFSRRLTTWYVVPFSLSASSLTFRVST